MGIMENIHFKFGPVVQEEMSFKESLRTHCMSTQDVRIAFGSGELKIVFF